MDKHRPTQLIELCIAHGALRCDTINYDTIRCDAMRYDAKRNDTIRNDTIRYNTIRYGIIWYDTIRCDATRRDTIWYDPMRYDTMRYRYNIIAKRGCDPSVHPVVSMIYPSKLHLSCSWVAASTTQKESHRGQKYWVVIELQPVTQAQLRWNSV